LQLFFDFGFIIWIVITFLANFCTGGQFLPHLMNLKARLIIAIM
jgi:hypothetical protein